MAKFADHIENIADGVTEGFRKIEDGVVSGYKQIEDGVVTGMKKISDGFTGAVLDEEGNMKTGKVGEAVMSGYKKVENAFVNTFLAKEGESVEEAKVRVEAERKAREEKLKDGRNAGKIN